MLVIIAISAPLLAIECGGLFAAMFRDSWPQLLPGSQSYARSAAELSHFGSLSSGYRPPLYSLLLAGAMRVAGDNWQSVLLATQIFLFALTAAVCACIVYSLSASRLACCLCFILFAGHTLLVFEVMTLRETILYTAIEVSFFAVLTFFSFRGSEACLGILAGLAQLTRPTGFLLLVAALIGLKWKKGRTDFNIPVMLLTFLMTVFPWQLRLYHITGDIVVASSTSSGLNLWKGNNPYFGLFFPYVEMDRYEPFIVEKMGGADLTNHETDAALRRSAISYMEAHPGRSALSAAAKAVAFLSPLPIPLGTADLVEKDKKPSVESFKPRSGWLLLSIQGIIIYAGVLLFFAMPRTHLPSEELFLKTLFVLFLLSTMLYSLTFPETRFRLPLDPLLIVMASIGAAYFARKILIEGLPLNEPREIEAAEKPYHST